MLGRYSYDFYNETTALAYCLGISPYNMYENSNKPDGWTNDLANCIIHRLHDTTENQKFEICRSMSIQDIFKNNQDIVNGIYMSLYTNAIIMAKKYLSDGIAVNVSQISKFTIDMGYFELCKNNILCPEGCAFPVSTDTSSFNKEKNTKPYDKLKVSEEYKNKIKNQDAAAMHSRDTKLRTNIKSICSTAEKNSYINLCMHWVNQSQNDLPIYCTDILHTIISKFRKFDSSLKSLQGYIGQQEKTTKEYHRLIRNVYKNHVALSKIAFKEICSFYSKEKILDCYLHNYEIERLFHLQLLSQLLEVRDRIKCYYKKLTPSMWSIIDELLINFSYLPNAFNRKHVLAQIIKEAFDIPIFFDEFGNIVPNNQTNNNSPVSLTEKLLYNTLDCVKFLAHIYYPTLQRSFFYSMEESIRGGLFPRNEKECQNAFEEIIYLCQKDCFEKYLNLNIKTAEMSPENNYYLISKNYGYISFPQQSTMFSVVNTYPYSKESLSSLKGDTIDFLGKFYSCVFSPETYSHKIDFFMDYNYFGLHFKQSDDSLEYIKQITQTHCENALKNGTFNL